MNFKELSILEYKEIKEETILHYPEIKDFCSYPYPNHPKGCPNQSKCQFLNVPDFDILLECGNYSHFYLVYLTFDFKKYKEIRKKENPGFFNSEARLKCLLYWQGSLKIIIKKYIEELYNNNDFFYVLGCGYGLKLSFQERVASMEAVCINVFSTMKANEIEYEMYPKTKIVLCNLLCSKKQLSFEKNMLKRWFKTK